MYLRRRSSSRRLVASKQPCTLWGRSSARASLEEALKTAKAEVPKLVHTQQSGRSVRTRGETRSCVKSLERGRPRTDQSPGHTANSRLIAEHEFPASGTQLSWNCVLSVPEDVVDALESDLAVEDQDGPVEVFAMTDDAPEEFEGRPQMGRRVVLVPQSANGTPRSHFNDSNSVEADAFDRHSQSTISAPEPLGDDAASSDTETIGGISDVSIGGGPMFQWWRKCPWVQHFGTHCDGWTQWISLAFLVAEQWSCDHFPRFLCGGYRAAMRRALQEILNGAALRSAVGGSFSSCSLVCCCSDHHGEV